MAILDYLGFNRQALVAKDESKSTVRALPASWYTSEEMYQLERRAIFSKRWMLITHRTRLGQSGDYLKFDIAGYEFVLCRDRKGEINGFHNVCRHRAFPVVQGQQGTAKIFACKYHGWSYALDGKLAKAPKYDELEDFDKAQNGLFPIHVRVDACGFIWVNLDSSETPEVPWEQDFDGVDIQERYMVYNFDDYILDHEYKLDGAYNWKILADNFNECYHCPTAHPDIPTLADIETHDVTGVDGYITHQSTPTEEQKKLGMAIASTYFFPNVSISVLPHFIMLQRFLPNGPKSSSMHYQIYRNKNSTEEDFQRIHQLYAKVVSEDKILCELAQRNLNAGVFVNGQMHPRLEKGPLYFQQRAREAIKEHVAQEKAERREIWPAQQRLPGDAAVSKEDVDLCSGLSCQSDQAGLAW
ncbi:Rieske [2Fe-2S] domain-containing protein [Cladophialophora immunda]|nr:Rieske [2Fe-2S] domain-containing protein [Cladophialophora immunda]